MAQKQPNPPPRGRRPKPPPAPPKRARGYATRAFQSLASPQDPLPFKPRTKPITQKGKS